jgi:hypothetical protein
MYEDKTMTFNVHYYVEDTDDLVHSSLSVWVWILCPFLYELFYLDL